MYDELIKRIHRCAVYLPEKFSKNAELLDVLMKAANVIEELSKEVDKWKAKYAECFHHSMELFEENQNFQDVFRPLHEPRWIPVEERLPQETQRCIVVSKCGEIGFAISTGDDFMLPYYFGKPTHWMPLPEPPKAEEGE